MAIINSHGIMQVTSIPTHTPTSTQARLARLVDTMTFFLFNGSAWITIRLDSPETFMGNIIPDNVNIGTALQALETAIEAVTQDGNHTLVTRTNGTINAEPTAVEVPSPTNGDTADILLNNGILEKWAYTGGSWTKAFFIDYADVTNLNYVPSPTQGIVESSNGNNATVPAVTATNAGLMLPSQKVKSDFLTVTQNVNLDTVVSDIVSIFAQLAEPTGYLSKADAVTALGNGKKFQYLPANLDGAVEGTVAWT